MATKRERCKELLHEFVETSTFHGLPGVVTAPSRWMRVTWMILFLAATSICLYQTGVFFDKYIKRPVEIETRIMYEPVEFPAVTFCNLNSIRKSQLSLGGEHLTNVLNDAQNAYSGDGLSEKRKRRSLNPEEDENRPALGGGMQQERPHAPEQLKPFHKFDLKAHVNESSDGNPRRQKRAATYSGCDICSFQENTVHCVECSVDRTYDEGKSFCSSYPGSIGPMEIAYVPTQAQHDALYNDIQATHQALTCRTWIGIIARGTEMVWERTGEPINYNTFTMVGIAEGEATFFNPRMVMKRSSERAKGSGSDPLGCVMCTKDGLSVNPCVPPPPTTVAIHTTTQEVETTTPEVETTTPKVETTTPEVETTTSEVETTTSKVETTPHKVETTTPKVETTTSAVQTTTPEVKTTTTEVKTTIHEVETTTPEVKTTTTKVVTTTPEVKTTIHEVETTTTEVKTTTPVIETTTPEVETTTSEVETTTPEVKTTTTEVKTTIHEVETTITEVKTVTPVIETTTSEVKTTTPEVESTTPEVERTTSELKTTTPEVLTTKAPMSSLDHEAYTVTGNVVSTSQTAMTANSNTNSETSSSTMPHVTTSAEHSTSAQDLDTSTGSATQLSTTSDIDITTAYLDAITVPEVQFSTQTTFASASTPITSSPSTTRTAVPSDPSNDNFEPDVDLSDKPWFKPGEEVPTVTNEIQQNVSLALASIPVSTKQRMGFSLADMLQECTWNGHNCGPLNFTSTYNSVFGNCYSFKTQNTAVKAGPHYGLSLMLFINQQEYIGALSQSAGVRFLVHRPDQYPFVEDEGFNASPGTLTSVKIRLTNSELYEPYRGCLKETQETLFNATYSLRACQKTCFQESLVTECGCADPQLPTSAGVSLCTSADTACWEIVYRNVLTQESCKCKEICRDVKFSASISTSAWPGQGGEPIIEDVLSSRSAALSAIVNSKDGIKNNFLKLSVFHDEIKKTIEIEKPAYLFVQCLSDIGGIVGILIGISIISIMEFMVIIIRLAMVVCGKSKAIHVTSDQSANNDSHNVGSVPEGKVTEESNIGGVGTAKSVKVTSDSTGKNRKNNSEGVATDTDHNIDGTDYGGDTAFDEGIIDLNNEQDDVRPPRPHYYLNKAYRF